MTNESGQIVQQQGMQQARQAQQARQGFGMAQLAERVLAIRAALKGLHPDERSAVLRACLDANVRYRSK